MPECVKALTVGKVGEVQPEEEVCEAESSWFDFVVPYCLRRLWRLMEGSKEWAGPDEWVQRPKLTKVGFEAETEKWSFDAFVVVDGHLDVVVDFAGLGYVGVVVADDLIQQNSLLQWRGSRLG